MASEVMLSAERIAQLSEAERLLALVDIEYDKAEECGIPCQQLREIRQNYGRQIQALKANYTPFKPKRIE
jgi:uncharacterized protein involved in exopolysaccharide biosynthesis